MILNETLWKSQEQSNYAVDQRLQNLGNKLDQVNPLEQFFKDLTQIKFDHTYTLPSWNTFRITHTGIIFSRKIPGTEKLQKETREISAQTREQHTKGKDPTLLWLKELSHTPNGRKIHFDARVNLPFVWETAIKQEPQILPWREIADIFFAIEYNKKYVRPAKKDGHTFKTIVTVSPSKKK